MNESLPLDAYPRPQLRRESYLCLNGSWDFYMGPDPVPGDYPDSIVVPFSPESTLSGIGRQKAPGDTLLYRRSFILPEGFRKDRVLLHFGAVDCLAEVSVNGIPVGSHRGGYWAFSFDITEALAEGGNELTVTVTDEAETAFADARGKQCARPRRIWYPGQSGIWQTVWLESVPANYIRDIRITPCYDRSEVMLFIDTVTPAPCTVYFDDFGFSAAGGRTVHIPVPGFRSWSPEDPYLYPFTVCCGDDSVTGYFAMRKFSVEKDGAGTPRLFLNGKPYFCTGVLDQGYWADGLYTPPSAEAMAADVRTMKDLGFNMLRKHAKIEPLLWYYICDMLGMLVWQDVVNGGGPYRPEIITLPTFLPIRRKDSAHKRFGRGTRDSRALYYHEMEETVSLLYNSPSVVLWTAFNEGCGQFDALRVTKRIRELDGTRLIDHASGWYDQGGGDIDSRHIYFFPPRAVRKRHDDRALCLTEFGGYSLSPDKKNKFGYRRFSDAAEFSRALKKLYRQYIIPGRRSGLSAAVYTQLSDCFGEDNGLLDADRTLKIRPEVLLKINAQLRENDL